MRPAVDDGASPLDGVRARGATDYFLRNLHEQLVQLSAQADLKASIVLTVSTVVLSISFSRAEPRTSTWVLGAGLFLALVAAILAVLPSFRSKPAREEDVDLLFFAQFAQLPKERYLEAMGSVMESDRRVYATLIGNIHNQAVYLMQHKYRYLRLSYVALLAAAAAAAVTEVASHAI
ncbi:MAG: Pycsar system effector family protein [Gaiellaceae bacterium]